MRIQMQIQSISVPLCFMALLFGAGIALPVAAEVSPNKDGDKGMQTETPPKKKAEGVSPKAAGSGAPKGAEAVDGKSAVATPKKNGNTTSSTPAKTEKNQPKNKTKPGDQSPDKGSEPLSQPAGDSDGGVDQGQKKPDTPPPSSVPADRMPTLALKVTPKEVSVGEVITWELQVRRRTEDSVHLGSGADFGNLEIKSKDKTDRPLDKKWALETLTVSLIGFEPGDVTIPGQTLTVVDVNGGIAEVTTDESHVTVKSLIANEPEPALKEDAGPPEKVMEEDYLLLYILGGLAAAALVALLTLLIRKLWARRRPKPEPPPPPPRPAEEIAYEKLNALKRSNLLAEGELKEYHVRLSEAVREYIGNRYGFDSLELSSEELIQAVRKVDISKNEYELILDFLGETDLVKFAKLLPSVAASEDLLEQSFRFVDRTTPKRAAATVESKGDQNA
jgi:hypothetical protein